MCKVGINPDTIAQCATDNAETLLQADADEQAWAKVALRTFYLFEHRERMENVFYFSVSNFHAFELESSSN